MLRYAMAVLLVAVAILFVAMAVLNIILHAVRHFVAQR